MKTAFYIVVNKKGSTRTTKTRPGLDWDEVSIRVEMELPDLLFQKPQLNAVINIPTDKVAPAEISVKLSNNIREAIEQHVGVPVSITVTENGDAKKK